MECPRHPLAVVIDIDGVIIQHKQKLEGATEAIERLQQDKVPFLFFTNNTAKNEQAKADQIT
jgi:ribonucleotide monophosphatase NagD (HAD superfamily)